MMGTVEQDLARYEQEQDRLVRESEWIAEKRDELLRGECNPENPDNFIDAIADSDAAFRAELGKLLKASPWNYGEIGALICCNVTDTMEAAAQQMAEDALEEEKDEAGLYRAECAAYAREPSFDWAPAGW